MEILVRMIGHRQILGHPRTRRCNICVMFMLNPEQTVHDEDQSITDSCTEQ